MTNYLSSIAARVQKPASPVRPRLAGRFEPALETTPAVYDRTPTEGREMDPTAEVDRTSVVTKATRHISNASNSVDAQYRIEQTQSGSRPPEPPPDQHLPRIDVTNPAAGRSEVAPTAKLVSTEPDPPIPPRDPKSIVYIPKSRRARTFTPQADPPSTGESGEVARVLSAPRTESRGGDRARPVAPAGQNQAAVSPPPVPFEARSGARGQGAEPERYREAGPALPPTLNDRQPRVYDSGPGQPAVADAPRSSEPKHEESKPAPPAVQSRIAPIVESGPEIVLPRNRTAQPPIIKVTVGRIEVRAVQSTQSTRKTRATPPVMNLDDYLRRRDQGGAR